MAGLSLASKAELGEKDSALKDAEHANMLYRRADKNPMDGPASKKSLARIHMIFGENGRAISILTRILQTPYGARFTTQCPLHRRI